MQYQQDYDETCPQGVAMTAWPEPPANGLSGTPYAGVGANGPGWAGQLAPYIKSTQIFTCPSDTTAPVANTTAVSYAYNAAVPSDSGFGVGDGCTVGVHMGVNGKLAALNSPSKTVMLVEVSGASASIGGYESGCQANTVACSPATYGSQGNLISTSGSITNNVVNPEGIKYETGNMTGPVGSGGNYNGPGRHLDGANYAFCDGHIKWLKGAAVAPGLVNPDTNAAVGVNTDCPLLKDVTAAGASNSSYAATFSPN